MGTFEDVNECLNKVYLIVLYGKMNSFGLGLVDRTAKTGNDEIISLQLAT